MSKYVLSLVYKASLTKNDCYYPLSEKKYWKIPLGVDGNPSEKYWIFFLGAFGSSEENPIFFLGITITPCGIFQYFFPDKG